jgi:hypothetical protein
MKAFLFSAVVPTIGITWWGGKAGTNAFQYFFYLRIVFFGGY